MPLVLSKGKILASSQVRSETTFQLEYIKIKLIVSCGYWCSFKLMYKGWSISRWVTYIYRKYQN